MKVDSGGQILLDGDNGAKINSSTGDLTGDINPGLRTSIKENFRKNQITKPDEINENNIIRVKNALVAIIGQEATDKLRDPAKQVNAAKNLFNRT